MKGKWVLPVAIIALILFVFIGGSIYVLGFGRVKNPNFCALCHETKYDYNEYALNTKKLSPIPRGVQVGCAECHPQPFKEFKGSNHFQTDSKDKPGCVNCHTPHRVYQYVGYMFFAANNWEEVMGSLKDNRRWEEVVRPRLAKKAREYFLKTDSKQCRNCHLPDNFPPVDVVSEHEKLLKGEKTCIQCHFNLVHREVPWPEMEEK